MWPLPYRGGPGEGEGDTGQALLVAGGHPRGRPTSSVLTLLPSATSWTPLSPLPRRLSSLASSMVGGRLWLVGGEDDSYDTRAEVGCGGRAYSPGTQVLQYEPSMDTWTPKGSITGGRRSHGMVAVGPQDLPCFTGA